MSPEVNERAIQECARALWVASRTIWEKAENAAATAAATKSKADGGSEFRQQGDATKARYDAVQAREDLTWEVFARPGRWVGKWQLAPAFPDGRLEPEAQATAERGGNLIVSPADSEKDIAARLEALATHTTKDV